MDGYYVCNYCNVSWCYFRHDGDMETPYHHNVEGCVHVNNRLISIESGPLNTNIKLAF